MLILFASGMFELPHSFCFYDSLHSPPPTLHNSYWLTLHVTQWSKYLIPKQTVIKYLLDKQLWAKMALRYKNETAINISDCSFLYEWASLQIQQVSLILHTVYEHMNLVSKTINKSIYLEANLKTSQVDHTY